MQEEVLLEKKEELVRLIDDFTYNTLFGSLRGLWKLFYAQEGVKLEDEKNMKGIIESYMWEWFPTYYNEGVYNMVTGGSDTYFMEKFTEMKNLLNHGYRCLLNFSFFSALGIFQKIDLEKIRFDENKRDFVNFHEIVAPILESRLEENIINMSHACGSGDEDITKWDPEVPMFRVAVSYKNDGEEGGEEELKEEYPRQKPGAGFQVIEKEKKKRKGEEESEKEEEEEKKEPAPSRKKQKEVTKEKKGDGKEEDKVMTREPRARNKAVKRSAPQPSLESKKSASRSDSKTQVKKVKTNRRGK